MTSTTDALGRRREMTYDSLGRVTEEAWYNSGGMSPIDTLSFQYDAINRLTAGSTSTGTQTMAYDVLNRVTHVNQLVGASQTFTYDAIGQHIMVEDSINSFINGGVELSVYDALGNLTSRRRYDKQPVTVNGHFFNDTNNNGVQDGVESDISGLTVSLFAAGSTAPSATAVTDANGEVVFTTIQDVYQLGIASATNYKFARGNNVTMLSASGASLMSETLSGSNSLSIGLSPVSLPQATGTIFSDLDSDGVQDGGESGISGISVSLSTGGTATTDSSGNFTFTAPYTPYTLSFSYSGAYRSFSLNDGIRWTNSSGTSAMTSEVEGASSWSVGLGGSLLSYHFFNDTDDSGAQNGAEANLSGVSVILYGTDGATLGSAVSDSSGNVSIRAPLFPYNIQFSASGYFFRPNTGIANVSGAAYIETSSSFFAHVPLRNTGNYTGTSGLTVSGRILNDSDSSAVSGVTVSIYAVTSGGVSFSNSTTTDGSGNYSLTTPASTYYVSYGTVTGSYPANSDLRWTATDGSTASGGVRSNAYSVPDIRIVANSLPTVAGTVFDDLDGDGVQDGGENGISGVTVIVYPYGRTSGGVSTTTDGSGEFSVTAPTQAYQVQIARPAGRFLPLDSSLGWNSALGTTTGTTDTRTGSTTHSTFKVGMRGGDATTIHLFDDLDYDGVQDFGEADFANITVAMYTPWFGTLIDTAVSDSSGNVSVPTFPGLYHLSFTNAPLGKVFPLDSDLAWMSGDGRPAISTLQDSASTWSLGLRHARDAPVHRHRPQRLHLRRHRSPTHRDTLLQPRRRRRTGAHHLLLRRRPPRHADSNRQRRLDARQLHLQLRQREPPHCPKRRRHAHHLHLRQRRPTPHRRPRQRRRWNVHLRRQRQPQHGELRHRRRCRRLRRR